MLRIPTHGINRVSIQQLGLGHLGAGLPQLQGDASADAAARAGDQGDLASERGARLRHFDLFSQVQK